MRNLNAIGFGLLLFGGTVCAQQYFITTVAGGGLPVTPTVATSVALQTTSSVAADATGSVYFSINNSVLKVDASGILTVVAGSSTAPGYSGDGGVATSAQLNQPSGLTADASGNLFIADTGNSVIRKVAAVTGIITTVAGNGSPGYTGDAGPATSAQLNHPRYAAVDGSGDLYIADTGNNAVRRVAAATGLIVTVAGTGAPGYSGDAGPATGAQFTPSGVALDGASNLYISDAASSTIREVAAATGIISTVAGTGTAGYSGDRGPATSARLSHPTAVATDSAGNLYIADSGNIRIRKVTAATGMITTVAGGGTNGESNGVATAAQLGAALSVAVDAYGSFYIAGDTEIRRVAAATGNISTAAGNGKPGFAGYLGDGGPAASANFSAVQGVAVDGSGNLYVADSSNYAVRKVAAATGIVTTVAGNGTPGYSGDGGPATSAQLAVPYGVAADGPGDLYFAQGYVVRKVAAATGIITTVAGNGTSGSSGDGGPATAAQLTNPTRVAVDGQGNLYIADGPAVRMVKAATGTITTVAGNGTVGYSGDGGAATSAQITATAVAVDGSGNLYIGDLSHGVVRKVTAASGVIATVAGNGTLGDSGDGGPATGAGLAPQALAVDAAGNLYIADFYSQVIPCGLNCNGTVLYNERIREVAAATGIITTLAGDGKAGYSGDGGPASSAQVNGPLGVAVDSAGNLYVADNGNLVVRMLVPEATHALLSISSTRSANFAQGQTDAAYSVAVSNAAGTGPTSGTVTVTEIAPAGLTLVSMSGTGWSCSGAGCTRNDVLGAGSSYSPITVTVSVATNAPALVMNQVTVSGGGSTTSSASDLTTIGGLPAAPVLISPANGAQGVATTPALAWNGPAGTMSYDVHFGTVSPPPLATRTTGTSYSTGTLTLGLTYYWQVLARNDAGSASSPIWSFTTGVPLAGSQFVPVPPCRVADTRMPASPFGGPSMTAGSTRTFAIPQSACNIPATAQAYSVNVTVVPNSRLSYLTLWAAGQPQPAVSTLNSWGGIVVANAALVPAGSGGGVSVYASDETDVILDVNGYFETAGGPGSSSFYTATPCRVADTRGSTGQFGGPSMFGGQTRDFPIPMSSCPVPATSTAYSLNVTAVPGTTYLGYLSAWPTGQSQPVVSTLNSWTGKVVANVAIVPAGTNGSVSVLVSDPADVVLDMNGYFGPPGGAGALAFYPVTPCRVADTRNPVSPFGGPEMLAGATRSFAIPASACGVPSTAAAYSLNVTVVPDAPLPYLTAWATGAPQPNVSTLNSWDGSVVANAAIVPAGTNGEISIYVTANTNLVLDINGYFAP